jgi:DNA polymerase III alpha subunit
MVRMAMFLAVMRPGKANLRNYDWKAIAKTVWDKPMDGSYYFKKAHAVAYAHLVALHINLLEEGD